LSISKKLAAVVSAAAVVAGMFAASTPANAESVSAFIDRTVSNDVERPIDPTNHTIKFYAGENFDLYLSASIKQSVLTSKVSANSVLAVDGGWTLVSGTMPTSIGKNVNLSGQIAGAQFNEMLAQGATELKLSKTLSAAPSNVNVNINLSGIATTDIVFTFNPTVKIGDYTLVAADFDYNNLSSGSHTGGTWSGGTGTARIARAEDTAIHFFTESACVNTTGLVNGDVLVVSMPVSDGTSDVGEFQPYWRIKNDQGMSSGMGTNGTEYTFAGVAAGSNLTVDASKDISSPVAGKTYTYQGYKVVKQGTTTNLLTHCITTGATGTVAVTSGNVVATLDVSADSSGMMGNKFDSYTCQLYATSDTNHATVVKAGYAFAMGMMGPNSAITCTMRGVPAGTYVVGLRGSGWKGLGDEKYLAGTVTVTGGVTPPVVVKKTPKVPTVATKLKVSKTLTVALHATKGTASKGANSDGLATVVTVASASKSLCSVAKVIKSKKITGYTVKGLKAGKCSVVVTITGSSTFNALTKTVAVTVTK